MTQTLAHGPSLSQMYGDLGGHSGRMVAPLRKASSFYFGLPGEGKSALMQSMSGAYIFNLDVSSTTCPTPKALMFPGIHPVNGRPLGDAGEEIVLTYNQIDAKVTKLVEMAAANKPRPETIVFDSLSSWISLLIPWVTEHSVRLCISQDVKTDFKQLHGPSAWDEVYNTVTRTIGRLKNAGYGVAVVGHVVNAKIPLNEQQFLVRPELTITENFWKRLYPMFELSALVYADTVTEKQTSTRTITVRGESKIETYTKEVPVRKCFLTVEKIELAGIAKSRVTLPSRIELPKADAWGAFERAYTEASQISV